MQRSIRAVYDDVEQADRFCELKQDSMKRIGASQMKHGVFLTMLMDVWEHQLKTEAGGIAFDVVVQTEETGVEESEIRVTEVDANAQDA